MVDWSALTPADDLTGDDLQDTHLLHEALDEATRFLEQFSWCQEIRRRFFGWGVGGVVAVFLFEITPRDPGVDELLWVVAGDVPPAYLVTDDLSTPREALAGYVELMAEWVSAAREGRSVEDLIPVNVEATPANAERLASRLAFIENEFLSGRD
jgi:hypothetical protein